MRLIAPFFLYVLAAGWAWALPIGCGSAKAVAAQALGLVAMTPFVFRRAGGRLRPPTLPWLATPLAHLPIALLLSVGAAAITIAGHRLAQSGCGTEELLMPAVRRALIFYALAAAAVAWLTRRAQA